MTTPPSPWTAPLDLYCERLGPGLWAEPLNAVSNAAFVAAGVWALAVLRRTGRRDVPAFLLAGVVLAVGIGSFLFHTFANRWSLLADVIPIAVFIYGYVLLALSRFAGWPLWAALGGTGLFMALNLNVNAVAPALLGAGAAVALGGSLGYVPALLALVVVGVGLWLGGAGEAGRALLLAALIFALSLAFRTVDGPACAALPFGTHFVWHLLNAAVLLVLLRAAILHGPAARPA